HAKRILKRYSENERESAMGGYSYRDWQCRLSHAQTPEGPSRIRRENSGFLVCRAGSVTDCAPTARAQVDLCPKIFQHFLIPASPAANASIDMSPARKGPRWPLTAMRTWE